MSAYTPRFFYGIGGFPCDRNSGIDGPFDRAVQAMGEKNLVTLSPKEAFYINRINNGSYHTSSFIGSDQEGWEKIGEIVKNKWKPGIYKIEPEWKMNYLDMVQHAKRK